MAKQKGFTISHRAFRLEDKLNRELWWFGDQDFKLLPPEEGLSAEAAIEWLRILPKNPMKDSLVG